ncbi:hypothetical protein [Bosea sp. 685]|uniref:hypothetical protein n=1 Tax=Bosea sp. 685 TaxID=3080057 RepID=UPI002892C621|nr:hypothetical protein [Bosea sp. 685]WNJ90917.1 hypothetical protein RMR04_32005 [Bosea sp. 685]
MAGNSKPTKLREANTNGQRPSKKGGGEEEQGKGSPDACDVTIDVDLDGVRAAALVGLRNGDSLYLDLVQAAKYPVIICKKQDGTVVGSLAAFLSVTQLVKCLQMGVQYEVAVTHVDSGSCHVFGQRKQR